MPFTVQHLIPKNQEPVSVREDESAQTALMRMTKNDFSQLPVVTHDQRLKGMITSDSILRAVSYFRVTLDCLKVSHSTVRVKAYRIDDDLSELLKGLKDINAIPIVDRESKLKAIVTSYDTAEYFRRRAEDIMLAEDIETTLRDFIESVYKDESGEVNTNALYAAIEDITPTGQDLKKKFKKAIYKYSDLLGGSESRPDKLTVEKIFDEHIASAPRIKDFDELTLSEYIRLFQNQWDSHHQAAFREIDWAAMHRLLDEVRKTRNAVAHFREVTPQQREKLQFCSEFLERHRAMEASSETCDAIKEVKRSTSPLTNDNTKDFLGYVQTIVSENSPRIAAGDVLNGLQTVLNQSGELSTNLLELINHDEASNYFEDIKTPEAELNTAHDFSAVEEELEPDESRYAPLGIWLQSQDEARVVLTFKNIEEIIQDELPNSARQHRNWWANDTVTHTQSQNWLDSGWRVSSVNMGQERVTFSKIGEQQSAYIEFFNELLKKMQSLPNVSITAVSNPQGRHWFTVKVSGKLPETVLAVSFGRRSRLRIEHYIGTIDRKRNKNIFNELRNYEGQIEKKLEYPVSWEPLYGKLGCRIAIYRANSSIVGSSEELETMQEWICEMLPKFYEATAQELHQSYNSVLY